MSNILEDLAAEYWTICQLVNQEEMIDDDFQSMVDAQARFYDLFFEEIGDSPYIPEILEKINDKLVDAREIGYRRWAETITNRIEDYYKIEFDLVTGRSVQSIKPDCIDDTERALERLIKCNDFIVGSIYDVVIQAIENDLQATRRISARKTLQHSPETAAGINYLRSF